MLRTIAVALLVIVSVVVQLGPASSTAAVTSPSSPSSTATASSTWRPPVLLVHGYNSKGSLCEGINLDSYWRAVTTELTERRRIPVGRVLPVSFYKCDTHGVDITGSGPGTDYPPTKTPGTTYPRAGVTTDASIVRIARDLAWFTYNEFTRFGRTVYVIGHSMGGLIIREALRRVQAGDPAFPRRLDVLVALTVSTPHAGWQKSCSANTQCSEMTPGSPFLAALRTNRNPQGVNGTQWWAMATQGELVDGATLPCDGITTASATALNAIRLVYVDPCYRHNQYLNDADQTLDAEGSAVLRGRHSVAMMGHVVK